MMLDSRPQESQLQGGFAPKTQRPAQQSQQGLAPRPQQPPVQQGGFAPQAQPHNNFDNFDDIPF
jgi:hypothetical protein